MHQFEMPLFYFEMGILEFEAIILECNNSKNYFSHSHWKRLQLTMLQLTLRQEILEA